jgi:hypothetical protein
MHHGGDVPLFHRRVAMVKLHDPWLELVTTVSAGASLQVIYHLLIFFPTLASPRRSGRLSFFVVVFLVFTVPGVGACPHA